MRRFVTLFVRIYVFAGAAFATWIWIRFTHSVDNTWAHPICGRILGVLMATLSVVGGAYVVSRDERSFWLEDDK